MQDLKASSNRARSIVYWKVINCLSLTICGEEKVHENKGSDNQRNIVQNTGVEMAPTCRETNETGSAAIAPSE